MRKLVLAVLALTSIAVLCVSCGESSKKVVPATSTFAFLQQKPNSYLFYPVLGTLTGSQLTTTMIKDPSTGNYVAADIGSIILSPDGKKATLEVYGGTDEANPTDQWDIYIGTIDGANLVQVTNDTYEDDEPQFDPSGTKVAYSSHRGPSDMYDWLTVVRNADGTGEQVLALPSYVDGTWHPSYSPDGNTIAVEAWGSKEGVPFYGILTMKADGNTPTILTNPYNAECWCWDETPFFTSDGAQIVFSREDMTTGIEDIYIMNTDGTGVTKLTAGTGYNFDPMVIKNASNQTDLILFSSNRDSVTTGYAGFELYSMKLDGTALTRLTNNNVYDAFNIDFSDLLSATAARTQHPHARRTPVTPPRPFRW